MDFEAGGKLRRILTIQKTVWIWMVDQRFNVCKEIGSFRDADQRAGIADVYGALEGDRLREDKVIELEREGCRTGNGSIEFDSKEEDFSSRDVVDAPPARPLSNLFIKVGP